MQARVRPANPGRFAKPGAPGAHSPREGATGTARDAPEQRLFRFRPGCAFPSAIVDLVDETARKRMKTDAVGWLAGKLRQPR